MVGKPAEPPHPGGAQHVERERADANQRPHERIGRVEIERIGPVDIERLRKDDGRALILYSSIDPAGDT